MLNKFKFSNISIGWKFGLTLILVFVLFGTSAGIVTSLIHNIGNDIDAVDRRGERAINVTEMGSITRSKSVRIASYINDPDQTYVEEYQARQEEFNALEADLKERMDTQVQKDLFAQISENDKHMNDLFLEVIVPAVEAGEDSLLYNLQKEAGQLRAETVQLLDGLRETVIADRQKAIDTADKSSDLARNTLLIAIIASILIGGVLVFLISRLVSRNLNKVIHVSDQIAEGNLAVEPVHYKGSDEIGRLASSVNTMGKSLKEMVQKISGISETVSGQSEELTQSANEVKAGSQQIATTMQEMASGSESQANSASELAAVMGTFSEKVQTANENGELIQQSSDHVLGMTEDGSRLMDSSIEQMTKIDAIVQDAVKKVQGLDTQSQEISKLVSVIKDIAEQTNLLALNAAIEAARAGEHGKGFAVVADEVRKLAEQVGVSVTDITGIVGSIQTESGIVAESLQGGYKEVEQGTHQIKTTGETFKNINNSVSEMAFNVQTVSENLASIAANSQEMNASIEEIASISEEAAAGVEQTSASSQQTSSSMEEVADSSEELSKLAEELNGLVRQFKL
ncbi:methyl-accepting chemotaxis protein [Sediminibacillus albus]|uniref:Methyl-accepting chemotaxis protein n=1 Tax=Sediminibacillus albus TaxID=407036 RepID=A0A1G8YB02_9BACI|nr:HAMP domain-containing methyl-accepting chemotaxis protein [Sediminibacillus albus]SDK00032.1 methyl-accepting chemotaxis protein [Sediminibacillus albus]